MSAIDVTVADEAGLDRAFRWLTRTGAGRHFGSMPIGWYQIHQCHALAVIEEACKRHGLDPKRVRTRGGYFQAARLEGKGWGELKHRDYQEFEEADKRSRT